MQRAIEHCVWLIWDYGLSEDQKPWRVNQNNFFFFFFLGRELGSGPLREQW